MGDVVSIEPLWSRALKKRMRELEARELERVRVRRADLERAAQIRVARDGIRCVGCGKSGAVFGDPRTDPRCGHCWRRKLHREVAAQARRGKLRLVTGGTHAGT